jgi:hypothetical protein
MARTPTIANVAVSLKSSTIVEHVSEHGPRVTQVRGSLIVSSLATLRELSLLDRYLAQLPASHHDAILYALASSWLPIELAEVHYGACDALKLSDEELEAIGRHVSTRIVSTFLGSLMRTARLFTQDIEIPLRQYPRLWDRLLIGGSCSVTLVSAQMARIDSRGLPMFRYRYFKIAYAGLIRGAALVFRTEAETRIARSTDDSLALEVSWT